MSQIIRIKVLRALYLRGIVVQPCDAFEVSPDEAVECVGSHRAELVDKADAPLLNAASRRQAERDAPSPRERGESWIHRFGR